jgi:hypothetical protein
VSALLAERAVAARVSNVVELRQYTLHPGQRDVLIDVFEREFIQTQEACGMDVLGTFRDLDDPDRFVWMRGFADMHSRAAALAAFYGGDAWKTHRDVANATMVDWRDVHLLRPIGELPSPERVTRESDDSVVIATLYPLQRGNEARFAEFFERALVPLLWNASVPVAARLATESAPNTYPALPVRESDTVFVWLARHASLARAEQASARVEEALDWSPALAQELAAQLAAPAQVLRLAPTARSRLRG